MGNVQSTFHEQTSWAWQQLNTLVSGEPGVNEKNEDHDDRKDEFKPVMMHRLYNCDANELPDFVTIKEFGQTFYQFLSERGDKVDKELTLHDCYKVGGLLCERKGDHAGLIGVKSLANEDFVFLVEMVRKWGDESPQKTVDKKNTILTWMRKPDVLVDYRTDRQYLVLNEDDSYYYTLNIPYLMVVHVPHLKEGEKLDMTKCKPLYVEHNNPQLKEKHQSHIGSGPMYWPYAWQQFTRVEDLNASKSGPFHSGNTTVNMAAAQRCFESTRIIERTINNGSAEVGNGALVKYPVAGAAKFSERVYLVVPDIPPPPPPVEATGYSTLLSYVVVFGVGVAVGGAFVGKIMEALSKKKK